MGTEIPGRKGRWVGMRCGGGGEGGREKLPRVPYAVLSPQECSCITGRCVSQCNVSS